MMEPGGPGELGSSIIEGPQLRRPFSNCLPVVLLWPAGLPEEPLRKSLAHEWEDTGEDGPSSMNVSQHCSNIAGNIF